MIEVTSTIYTNRLYRMKTCGLAHVRIKAVDDYTQLKPRYNLILIVDCSDSMHDVIDKVKATILAVYRLIENNKNVRITVITFNRLAKVVFSDNKEDDRKEFVDKIESINAEGLTNIFDGLELGFKIAKNSNDRTLMILLSDGNPTAGVRSEKRICELVGKYSDKEGIILNTIGYGTDYNPFLLGRLGHYTHINDIESIPDIMGSMINVIENIISFKVTIKHDPKLKLRAIGKETFGPLFTGRCYDFALYFSDPDFSKDIEVSFTDLDGDQHTVKSTFEVKDEPPTELKKLYYDTQATKLIYRLQVESPEPILDRVNSWPSEGEEAANRVKQAVLHGYNPHTNVSMLISRHNQLAYHHDYDYGFMTTSQGRYSQEVKTLYSMSR